MQFGVWLEDMEEALSDGAIQESSIVIALHRNAEVLLGADGTWDARPVFAIEQDEDDIDLITFGSTSDPMTVADVRAWSKQNPECGGCELFVPESWEQDGDWSYRRDMPAIGPVMNEQLSQFGVMVWYDGCDSELG